MAGATTNDYQALKTVYFNLWLFESDVDCHCSRGSWRRSIQHDHGESRTLPRDFDQIDAVIETSRQDVQRYTELEKLAKLVTSWKKATASFELDGLKFETFDANNSSEMGNTYSGPLKGWPGQVIGDPQVVISSVRSLQKEIPLYLYDYSIANGVMKLNFVVVGT
ncbi:hypothetical protein P4193_01860 [Pseudomonas aeruginosa]|nr:hypothetical protein [Pseudomonas aeruginosa]